MAISTCAVTGNVKSLLGSNVQNCTIRVGAVMPFFHSGGPSWISGEMGSTSTDVDGDFSITVIETESQGVKLQFTFEYSDGASGKRTKTYSVAVPDDATVALYDLIVADTTPITSATFPASSVTVTPTGNLAASNAQAALQELQGDIDTINTLANGKIYIGNASNAATEVTPSGDVTISNDGTTAITTGVIVNSDISALAAIADTKLDTIATAGKVSNSATTAASANTASAIVARDGSGNFSAGTITASLTGNVTGNVTGTAATFTGSLTGDITSTGMATAIAAGVIVNDDIHADAGIARGKLATGTADHVIINAPSSGAMTSEANLAVTRGGTGTGTLTANSVIIGNGTSAVTFVAPGSSGNVLQSNGTVWSSGAAPRAAFSGARYETAAAQTVSNNEIIDFGTSQFDTGSFVTTGASWKFTAATTGYYRVTCFAQTGTFTPSAGNIYGLDLFKDGSRYSRLALVTANAAQSQQIAFGGSDVVHLTATNYVDVRGVSSAGDFTLLNNADANYIVVEFLGT